MKELDLGLNPLKLCNIFDNFDTKIWSNYIINAVTNSLSLCGEHMQFYFYVSVLSKYANKKSFWEEISFISVEQVWQNNFY